jgi:hypothetical protein
MGGAATCRAVLTSRADGPFPGAEVCSTACRSLVVSYREVAARTWPGATSAAARRMRPIGAAQVVVPARRSHRAGGKGANERAAEDDAEVHVARARGGRSSAFRLMRRRTLHGS